MVIMCVEPNTSPHAFISHCDGNWAMHICLKRSCSELYLAGASGTKRVQNVKPCCAAECMAADWCMQNFCIALIGSFFYDEPEAWCGASLDVWLSYSRLKHVQCVIQNMPQIILYKLPWSDEIVIKGAIKSNQFLYECKLQWIYSIWFFMDWSDFSYLFCWVNTLNECECFAFLI